jgi:hypothetical protein
MPNEHIMDYFISPSKEVTNFLTTLENSGE